MEAISLTRQQLYDLVWSEPLISIAQRLNIDYSVLRKACQQIAVPIPGSGYWSKLKHGKKVIVHPLPAEYKGEQSYYFTISTPNLQKEKAQKKAELQELVNKTFRHALSPPDKIIRKAQESMIEDKYNKLFYTPTANVNICVPEKLLQRALKIIDTFLKIMRQRGDKLETYENYYRRGEGSYLVVGSSGIEMALREAQSRVITERFHSYNFTKLKPKGTLRLSFSRFSSSLRFDEDKMPLEEQLADIVLRVEALDDRIAKEEARNELWRKEQEEKREQERLIEEQKRLQAEQKRLTLEKEVANAQRFFNEARRWKIVQELRAYINQVELTDAEKKADWLRWARAKADWLDPFVNGKEGAVENINPDEFIAQAGLK